MVQMELPFLSTSLPCVSLVNWWNIGGTCKAFTWPEHRCSTKSKSCLLQSAVPETTDDFLPGVGSSIVCPIRGGFSIGQETLNRAFTAHTLTLPAGAAIVSLLHFLLIRKQSVSGPLWRCWRCHVESLAFGVHSLDWQQHDEGNTRQ